MLKRNSRTMTVSLIAQCSKLTFHETFKLWRSSRNISARQLSLNAGLSASYVSKVESGAIIPPVNTFMRLMRELNCNDKEIIFLLGLAYEV